MIAKFEFQGATVHSKVVTEHTHSVDVYVPEKTCGCCNGKGVVLERRYRTDPDDARKMIVIGTRPIACTSCWGEQHFKIIKLKKKRCTLMPTVPSSFPSPPYWAPAEGAMQ